MTIGSVNSYFYDNVTNLNDKPIEVGVGVFSPLGPSFTARAVVVSSLIPRPSLTRKCCNTELFLGTTSVNSSSVTLSGSLFGGSQT